ncbi:maltase 1-like [Hylaeus anthracinus]|uniref:maltase 1-like n=1 Tax=Hylaeus anthracinus TaxID=313031 RepID=UPI0023B96093|nr:maltase 1-like [Hylaeus anthracinus]
MKSTGHIVILLLAAVALTSAKILNKDWWKSTVFYQIYPRSFMDSDGDGIGDLKGITSKLDHIKDAGIGAIWLSPIYKSPMVDFGYDIEDFRSIDKTFGTLDDLKALIARAKELALKVVLDLVPNHTSDKHEWFLKSLNKTSKYADYYMWKNTKLPPNNWLSVFNGSGWTFNEARKEWYFHQFYKEQPDLNYTNPAVQEEMKDVIKYWLDMGIDGFRIDAVPHIFESNIDKDEPPSYLSKNSSEYTYLSHIYTKDQPQTYDLIQNWREFVDKYADELNQDEKVLLTEAYTGWDNTIKYYKYGSNVPFNFKFITNVNSNSTAADFKEIIDHWISSTPTGFAPNWVMGNHDRTRIGTRYPGRTDQMTMLAMILPGVAVTYYGEEIGMVDNSTLRVYDFRDGCRTPMQWNDSAQAGFSTNATTWLPVNTNYHELNLEKEKKDPNSHYNLYKSLTRLRNSSVALKHGNTTAFVVNNDVLAVVRNTSDEVVALLINFSNDKSTTVNVANLTSWKRTSIKAGSVSSGVKLK